MPKPMIENEELWEKIKEGVDKEKYPDEESYYAVIMAAYKKAGGKIKTENHAENIVENVELFAVGKHTSMSGDTIEYSEQDLDEMLAAYNEVSYKPGIKLGHSDTQELANIMGAQPGDLPALGWIDSLKKVGNKLVGSVKLVNDKVAKLWSDRAYRYVSAEIGALEANGKKYNKAIKDIALLGMQRPALKELASAYAEGRETNNILVWSEVSTSGGKKMDEKTEVKAFSEAEVKNLIEKAKAESEEKAKAEFLKVLAQRDAIQRFGEVMTEKNIPKSVKDLAMPIVEILAKHTETIKFGEATVTPLQQLTNAIEQAAKAGLVKHGESIPGGDHTPQTDNSLAAMEKRYAEEYVEDQKKHGVTVSYTDALIATAGKAFAEKVGA